MSSYLPEADLRGVFEKIDADGNGVIDNNELHSAMRLLGIKVSDNSARRVLKLVDTNKSGTIEWAEFKEFFGRVSDTDEIKKMLSQANHRYFDYKTKVETDANFEKMFGIPPFGPNAKCIDTGHADQIEEVRWLTDSVVVTGSLDGRLRIWDKTQIATFPKPVKEIKLDSALYSMTSVADGSLIVTGLGTGELSAWNVADETPSVSYQGHDTSIFSCAFDKRNVRLASGAKSGVVCLHDVQTRDPLAQWVAHEGIVNSVDFEHSGKMLCTGSSDGSIRIFDSRLVGADKSSLYAVIEDAAASEKVFRTRFRSDLELISSGDDYSIKRWDMRQLSQGPVGSYFGLTSPVRALELSPDGRFIATGTTSGSARLWLADEVGAVAELENAARKEYDTIQGQRQELVDLCQNGEPFDADELRDLSAEADEAQEKLARLKKARKERQSQDCTQACLALDSPSMSVSSIAWRALPEGGACIAMGAHDQKLRLFNFKEKELQALGMNIL